MWFVFSGVFVSSMDCSSGLWVALLGLCVYLPVGRWLYVLVLLVGIIWFLRLEGLGGGCELGFVCC